MIEVSATTRTDRNALRPIYAKQEQRDREAGLMLRRTVRHIQGTPAPHIKTGRGKRIYLRGSEVGKPPFKRTGRAQGRTGFASGTADGGQKTAIVSVDVYGYERDRTRPSLGPAYRDNRALLAAIMEGRQGAPRLGDVSAKPQAEAIRGLEAVRYFRRRGRATASRGKRSIRAGGNRGLRLYRGRYTTVKVFNRLARLRRAASK